MRKHLSLYKSRHLMLLIAIAMLAILIFHSDLAKASCSKALLLCAQILVPSLFPFFVLSAFISRLGIASILGKIISPIVSPAYGISSAGASALIMGFIGGYPSGAAYIAELEKAGDIKPEEAERLIAFCNNSGPAFIIGVIGNCIFNSTKIGIKLIGHTFRIMGIHIRKCCRNSSVGM